MPAAPAGTALVEKPQLIITEIKYQFESAARKYPFPHMETRVAVVQPEVLDEG